MVSLYLATFYGQVAVNLWLVFGLSTRSLWTLNPAWSLLPCPVCWISKLLETLDLPGVSFLPCAWVLKLLASSCLEPASLNCFSPLVCRTSCLVSSTAEEASCLSWSLGCDPIWEITGRSNDLFTYWFCKDKSTSLRPAKDLQRAMFNSVLSRFYNFYKL